MNVTPYEKGIAKGREEERRAVLREQIEEKFGPLYAEVRQRLEQLPADRLGGLTRAVLRAEMLRDLGLEN